jgi:hypothetical protein
LRHDFASFALSLSNLLHLRLKPLPVLVAFEGAGGFDEELIEDLAACGHAAVFIALREQLRGSEAARPSVQKSSRPCENSFGHRRYAILDLILHRSGNKFFCEMACDLS